MDWHWTARNAKCSATIAKSRFIPSTKRTCAFAPNALSRWWNTLIPAWGCWWACTRTNFPERSTLRRLSAHAASWSRWRAADVVERIVRANLAQGVHGVFMTDDNSARSQNWEAILDRLIYLREAQKIDLKCSIQVAPGWHRIPNFFGKARRAGVKRV